MTDTLRKAMAILIANPAALEELVKAMEACLEDKEYGSSGVDGSGLVEATVRLKHPLEDYQITEKDVGSLVLVGEGYIGVLSGYGADPLWPFETADDDYSCAEPYTASVALHFIPFYATEDSVAPGDLGDHFAVLWSDGRISALSETWGELWTKDEDQPYAVGYRPLKFVNPLEEV